MLKRKLLYILIILSIINLLSILFVISLIGIGYKEYNNHKENIEITIDKAKSLSGKLDEITGDILSVKYYIKDSIVNKLCNSYVGKYICNTTIA